MKQKMILTTLLGTLMIISSGLWAQQYYGQYGNGNGNGSGNKNRFQNQNRNDMFCSMLSNLPKESIDENETKGLLQLAEEEKLARDVYRTLYENWELAIFSNIATSEERHKSGVLILLEKYGIPSPITSDQTGSFASETMRNLYNQLVQRGRQSLTEALKVGTYIEDMDIFDIQNLLEQTDNTDIQILYQNLMKGSRNHLRAFYQRLSDMGENYSPTFLDPDTFNSIIETEWERGFNNKNGGQFYGHHGW